MAGRQRKRGVAIVITTIMLLIAIPAIGLAIDAGIMYLVRVQLHAASDAAALAAARSLNLGQTLQEQEDAAEARAEAYFYANYPDGYLGSNRAKPKTDLQALDYSTLQVNVETETFAPTYFMKIFGKQGLNLKVVGTATRRNVNLMLVLDRSGSMAGTPCTDMKAAAKSFLGYFSAGRDKIGLLTFAGDYNVVAKPSADFKTTLPALIDAIVCSGSTGSAQALHWAYEELKDMDEPLTLNTIVFFTDGQPNGVSGNYMIRKHVDQRYGYSGGYKPTLWNGSSWYKGSTSVCNNTSQLCNMEPSPCRDSSSRQYDRNSGSNPTYGPPNWNPNWFGGDLSPTYLQGAMTQSGGDTVIGLRTFVNGEGTIAANGCAFRSNQAYVKRDIAFIPDADLNGYSTWGYKTNYNYATDTYIANQDKFPAGHRYEGKLRPDIYDPIVNASYNAADNCAKAIRDDTTFNPVIYSIGLGGNPGYPADAEFLSRVANTGTADDTLSGDNVTRPRGVYAYAPNSAQLMQAFAIIASSVLRLSR
ncbi:MAG: vWA domain-containing protein [Bryobacteraceae bacterium]|nr:vWA domain-containing protein [Bryobacteraceae bacterium]